MSKDGDKLTYTIKFVPDITSLNESIDQAAAILKERLSGALKDTIDEMTPDTKKPMDQIMPNQLVEEIKSLRSDMSQAIKVWDLTTFGAIRTQRPQEKTLGNLSEQVVRELDIAGRSGETMGPLVATIGAAAFGSIVDRLSGSSEDIIGTMQSEIGAVTESISASGFSMRSSIQALAEILQNKALFKREFSEFENLKMTEQAAIKASGHPFMAQVGKSFLQQREPAGAQYYEESTFKGIMKMMGVSKDEIEKIPEGMKRPDMWVFTEDMVKLIDWKPILDSVEISIMESYNRILQDVIMPKIQGLSSADRARLGLGEGTIIGRTEAVYGAATGRNVEALEASGIMATDLSDNMLKQLQQRVQQRYPEWASKINEIIESGVEPTARSYLDNLMKSLTTFLGILRPSSLPPAFIDIGVDRWIDRTAVEYVKELNTAIGSQLQGDGIDIHKEPLSGSDSNDISRKLNGIELLIKELVAILSLRNNQNESQVIPISDLESMNMDHMSSRISGGPSD